jgi:MFS family permease
VSELALPLIVVTNLSASAEEVSVLTALLWAPNVLGVFIGSLADRQSQEKRLLVAADLLRAVSMASVPILWAVGLLTIWQMFIVGFVVGLGSVVFNTGYASLFAVLVPKEQFVEANSKLSATQSVSYVAGPAVGGFLIQALGAPFAVVLDSISFVFSASQVQRLRVRSREPVARNRKSPSLQGFNFTLRQEYLRKILAAATTVNFFTFLIANGLTILYASRYLHLSAGAIGIAYGIGSVGGLLASVVVGRLNARFGIGWVAVAGCALFPLPLVLLAVAQGSLALKVTLLAMSELLSSFGMVLFDVNTVAIRAVITPDGMRSRVSGVFASVNYGVRPLAALLGGVLASQLGLRSTILVAALGGALAAAWLLFSPIRPLRSVTTLMPVVHPGAGTAAEATT